MDDAGSAECLMRNYLSESGVREKILGHYLCQTEKSVAAKLDGKPIFQS